MFSEVFIAEEADGVRDKKSAYTPMFDVQTLLEAFLNMYVRSICSLMKKLFAGKKQNIQSQNCSPLNSQIITISELYDTGLMEFCHNKLYLKEK